MNKKFLTGVIAAATTVAGAVSIAAPANALNKTDSVWNQSDNVQDKSTDMSGFQDIINDFQQYVQQERLELPDSQLRSIDPNALKLKSNYNARVWFINEGAGFRNQLAYETTRGKNQTGKGMIFSDIACTTGCELSNGSGAALDIGDYADLGTIKAGDKINFWLKADGYTNANGHVYGAPDEVNPDGLAHTVSYLYTDEATNRDYVLIGFEDLFGELNGVGNSDRDFNDAVFVVDLGTDNVVDVPEPATATTLLGLGAFGAIAARRRKKKSA